MSLRRRCFTRTRSIFSVAAITATAIFKHCQSLLHFIRRQPKPVFSMEVEVVNAKEIQSELLNEKLAEIETGEIKVTEMGRRFVAEFEKAKEK